MSLLYNLCQSSAQKLRSLLAPLLEKQSWYNFMVVSFPYYKIQDISLPISKESFFLLLSTSKRGQYSLFFYKSWRVNVSSASIILFFLFSFFFFGCYIGWGLVGTLVISCSPAGKCYKSLWSLFSWACIELAGNDLFVKYKLFNL